MSQDMDDATEALIAELVAGDLDQLDVSDPGVFDHANNSSWHHYEQSSPSRKSEISERENRPATLGWSESEWEGEEGEHMVAEPAQSPPFRGESPSGGRNS